MNIEDILSEIDAEIARLQQAKALLGNTAPKSAVLGKRGPGRPPSSAKTGPSVKTTTKRRTMSAEGRARIAAAQKARWAKSKKAAKAAPKKKKVGRPAKSTSKKKMASAKAESTASQA